jgi:DNA (cytosine-5)-methyltransferase 1
MLIRSGLPFVIENVQGSPLNDPAVLCGQYFGLGVRRHRLFETNWPLTQPDCRPYHRPRPIAVYGDHPQNSKNSSINRAHTLKDGQEAMGIDWMPWKTLTQSIPPAYTEYIGKQLLDFLKGK